MKIKATLLTMLVLLALTLPACCETIGGIKKLLDGPSVMVTGVVTYVRPGECYVESEDRASGIWVKCNTAAIYPGDEVTASGWLSTINGERVITSSALYPTGYQKLVTPLGMPLSRIGGSWFGYQDCASDRKLFKYMYQGQEKEEWHWVTPVGLNNTGLLVTTWGRVVSTDYSPTNGLRWFHLDDGSGMLSDLGDRGVIVYSDADVKRGQLVSVTGISAVEAGIDDPTHLIRVLRPRSVVDVQAYDDPVVEIPNAFSDEFNGSELDKRWDVLTQFLESQTTYPPYINADVSLSVNPGWLTISVPGELTHKNVFSPRIVQLAEGDWHLDVRLRLDNVPEQGVNQGIGVVLRPYPTSSSGATLAFIGSGTGTTPYAFSLSPHSLTWGGNVWRFTITKRGDSLTSAMTDEASGKFAVGSIEAKGCKWLTIGAYSMTMETTNNPVTGCVDYIRFTPIDAQGGL